MENYNILDEGERETIGQDTWHRFEYQIHWAIYHALDKLNNQESFLIFAELHEDIIFCNDLNLDEKSKLEFFQIKSTNTSPTITKILSTKSSKNSTLGKMILGIKNKKFEKNIENLCLLYIEKFNFTNPIEIADKYYKFSELHIDDQKKIINAIKLELNLEECEPYTNIINFRKSSLLLEDSKENLKIKILRFIEQKYGREVQTASGKITRVLCDTLRPDLNPQTSYNYKTKNIEDWKKERGLSSIQIMKLIQKDTQLDQKIDTQVSQLINDYLDEVIRPNRFLKLKILSNISQYFIFKTNPQSLDIEKEFRILLCNLPNISLDDNIDSMEDLKEPISQFNEKVNSTSLDIFNLNSEVAIYEVIRHVYETIQ